MNKKMMMLSMVFVFVSANTSFAQLINWSRRNNNADQSTATTNPPSSNTPTTTQAKATGRAYGQAAEAVQNNATGNLVKVNSRIEQIYDLNKDGSLAKGEINSFLKDVLNAVKSNGSFAATSQVLKAYDKNNDGYINTAEAKSIEQTLR